jgi:uncharacterized repeat protein (TIGR03803 family)
MHRVMETIMQLKNHRRTALMLGALPAAIVTIAAITPLPAQALPAVKPLYAFCGDQDCRDGDEPSGTLLIDSSRNLFGTTTRGGQNDEGTIYEIVQNATTGSHRHKVIYDFCNGSACSDGARPVDGSLIMDSDGSLYGTTSQGGATGGPGGGGVVFKLTPNAQKANWTYTVIYNFCQQASCEDGLAPNGNLTYFGSETGVPYDKTSPLYGTTTAGGKHNNGIAFALTPRADGTIRETPIYFFCSRGGTTCGDGRSPTGGLAMDPSGVLAGTTAFGGINDAGVAFKLVSVGKPRWNESVMHQFCSSTGCADGMSPQSGLISDAQGNFYGTTVAGGNSNAACGSSGCGVAFEIDPHGLITQLYAFCSLANCADGGVPARLSLDLTGKPFGMTTVGGKHNDGTLYKLDAGYQDLSDFRCTSKNCLAGSAATGGLVMDTNNAVYGVMSDGGTNGTGGIVFKYTPPE